MHGGGGEQTTIERFSHVRDGKCCKAFNFYNLMEKVIYLKKNEKKICPFVPLADTVSTLN